MIIDMHAHIGTYPDNHNYDGDADRVVSLAEKANIDVTVVSHYQALFAKDTETLLQANDNAYKVVTKKTKLAMWVVLNPLFSESWRQAEEMLKYNKCIGVKIHPELHNYNITKHIDKILGFSSRRRAVFLSHAGDKNSNPLKIGEASSSYPDSIFIMAHLGNEIDVYDSTTHIDAILNSKSKNLFTDTSSSRSIYNGYLERAVDKIGAGKILFGSDSPIHFAPSQTIRVTMSDLTPEEKELIMGKNFLNVILSGGKTLCWI